MNPVSIKDLKRFEGKEVQLQAWVRQFRSSGKISFLILRDGIYECQCVLSQGACSEESFKAFSHLSLECLVEVKGEVKKWKEGFEIKTNSLKILSSSPDYPIAKKSHGVDFLLTKRHLWLRSKKQAAILHVRSHIMEEIRSFFRKKDCVEFSTPILVPTACEGTSSLFPVRFFDDKEVYLTQSGQLHLEVGAAALGKVYCFGPTFRAEKSSTRRHLLEFWMAEVEMAFYNLEKTMDFAEKLVEHVVQNVIKTCQKELEILERDISLLEKIKTPFPRMTYKEACEILKKKQKSFTPGKDFGANEETILGEAFDKPLLVHRYPKNIKSFYMKEDEEDNTLALNFDLIAPEAYGELIGGSQRSEDEKLLLQKMKEEGIDSKNFSWYLDLRRYGSFPHSGFGLGVERAVAWICGLDHAREAIPFPRLYGRKFFEKS